MVQGWCRDAVGRPQGDSGDSVVTDGTLESHLHIVIMIIFLLVTLSPRCPQSLPAVFLQSLVSLRRPYAIPTASLCRPYLVLTAALQPTNSFSPHVWQRDDLLRWDQKSHLHIVVVILLAFLTVPTSLLWRSMTDMQLILQVYSTVPYHAMNE